MDLQKIKKFSIFKLYILKEDELYLLVPKIFQKIISMAECYNYYYSQTLINKSSLNKLFKESSLEFFHLIEKKSSQNFISIMSFFD